MNFGKDTKKYFLEQLKGNITNKLNFTIKSLHQPSVLVQEPLKRCAGCKLPLLASVCKICKIDNQLPSETAFPQNFIHRQKLPQNSLMEQSMILCIDLSGSMSSTYKSKYHKINEQFVSRVLGEKNFEYLKKNIGLERVMKNYLDYKMFLNEGQSAKNIVSMIKMEESSKYGSSTLNMHKQMQKQNKSLEEYISRKQIIQIAVSKCLAIMKNRNPNTYITVVFFNDTIQIPTNNFNDKLVRSQIQNSTVQEMIQLGLAYSLQISKTKASDLGENLVMSLTKAYQNGQTAMGPALAFCLGLAKAFQHSLHQIVVVTDGMSNIGFGQTENQFQQENTKVFYQKLALQYAKPLNCVVNVLTFQDCCIGYEQLDQLVQFTGGIPCQIQFSEEGGQKVVTQQTFSNIAFKMSTAFCEYASQLCFKTRTIILCNNQKIKFVIPNQLKPFVEQDRGYMIILKIGIKSSSSIYQLQFTIPKDLSEIQSSLKFVIINQYERNNKKCVSVTTDKIKILKGTKQQAQKQQAILLQKQIKQKLKPRQIFQEDIKQYESISIKLQQNQNICTNLDKNLLEKFKMKKERLQKQYQNVDKLARQKMSMKSRAQKTYKEDKDDFDDGFM